MGKPKKKYQNSAKLKLNITFDPQARTEYLSGFHKRKLERKAYHKAKLEKQVVEERQRIKAKVKQSSGKVSDSNTILPEVEALLGVTEKSESLLNTYFLGSKVVTVSSLDGIHIKPSDISPNHSDSEDDTPAKNDDSEVSPVEKTTTTNSISNKAANRMLQNTKAFKAIQKLKQKRKKFKGKGKKIGRGKETASAPELPSRQPMRRKGQPRQKKIKSKNKAK